ncbi:TonB-dependent receptor plug domain-containing protein [Phenylobacterium montanum]|uniref:TonB-dependent receptor n=1 Tax=Phenylobacterium montanum TaxID=2823693 RepID=A0A975G3N4_9CAUL|nr:TonB-dependent receptor [Caulobacter sp. S6]QUD90081.1 TonB-dependent receptor [Caulobacter sp. S6]
MVRATEPICRTHLIGLWQAALAGLCASLSAGAACATAPPSAADLDRMPIEDLARIEVSSVSKTYEPLSDAAAAIYVITHEDIVRSGATSLPDLLRLAPNLQVAQVNASTFAVTARGFNGAAADKLLVLVDGRSVYTPFVNGVYWDAQDVVPEDIERIEVISGPGATLWGANAVNGVINIITRKAADTQGGFVEVGGGDRTGHAALRYGGRIGGSLAWRAYVDGSDFAASRAATGASADDAWRHRQGGFRLDWTPGQDQVTLQGDVYAGIEGQPQGNPDDHVSGHNLLARWTRPLGDKGTVQVQAYYDYLQRHTPGEFTETLRTYDLEAQHNFDLGARQQIVWGAGFRAMADDFAIVPGNPSNPLTQFFDPEKRTLNQGDLFAQDTVTLTPAVKLVVGLKLEDDAYSSVEPLPTLRLSWRIDPANLVWAAVSRAVRAPSRLDRDFNEVSGPIRVLTGGRFIREQLIAYDLGYRAQPTPRLSFSLSAYYNDYQDLRSFELTPVTVLPAIIENRMEGETYGVEAWAAWQVLDWWRLSAGAEWMHEDLRFRPGASGLGGIEIAGDDPKYQAQLQSMMNLGHHVNFGLDVRGVGPLPAPASPAYVEADARLAWAVNDTVEISLRGDNLFNPHHLEFGSGASNVQLGATGVESERSWYLATRLRF